MPAKLKKLSMQGYKTFATKTEFEFDSGITAVVGPNGSGKSNIADALRWVLGEQSYSSLRAKRTADMIFAGSAQRSRAGMAQATITLDNSDGWLPIDYTEVEIARRAFRSGENEYLLNGQTVRLKDIVELLSTSGLAQRTYTIIGQGLIDQALSLRSDERRALFEEAAGIHHYKIKRAETLRRLDETQRNLQRIHDILAELRPRLASLRRQATRTQNYEQLSAELHELLRISYGFKWEKAKIDLRTARAVADTAEASWQTQRKELLAQQQHIEQLQQQITQAQVALAEHQSDRDQVRSKLEKARREQAVYAERHSTLQRQITELEGETPYLQESHTNALEQLTAAADDLAEAQEQLSTQQALWSRFQSSSASHQEDIDRQRQEMAAAEADSRRLSTELAQAQGQLTQLQNNLAGLESQEPASGTAAAELAAVVAQLEKQETGLAGAETKAQALQKQLASGRDLTTKAAESLDSLRAEARKQDQQLERTRSEAARLEERVAALDRRRSRDINLKANRVLGQLAGLVDIPAEYETALSAALGERLALWIVSNSKDLWQAVRKGGSDSGSSTGLLVAALADLAPEENGGVIGRPEITRSKGVIDWASDLVQYKANVAPLVDLLFGSVLLVEEAETAYALARNWPRGYMAVSVDGIVVHAGGLVEARHNPAESSILAREARWREESERLDRLQEQVAGLESEASQASTAVEAQADVLAKAQAAEQGLNQAERDAGRSLAGHQSAVETARRQLDIWQRRSAQEVERITLVKNQIEALGQSINQHQTSLDEANARQMAAKEQLALLPVGETDRQIENLQRSLTTSQTIVAGRQAVVDSRRATLNQVEGQLARLDQRLLGRREELTNLAESTGTTEPADLQTQLDALEKVMAPLTAQIRDNQGTIGRLQTGTAAGQKDSYELETRLTQLRIRLAQQESHIEGLEERIRADLGLVALTYDDEQSGAQPLPMPDVVDQLPVVEQLPEEIDDKIQNLRGRLHRIGAVNPEAPAELTTTEERVEFLNQQIEDLTQTDGRLRGIIEELDVLTSQSFSETVEKVNSIFNETFHKLFGGGAARLEMTDPDDLTTSGVEIVARLPNRREQGLALLSGGERTLTGAALIFALLKVAPPPFCVLDEVDAALDEANINRFRDLLRELSDDIQFIIITHNRGTVQAAETIYGVSMLPDSASQVISIKPEDYLNGHS